MGNLPKISVVTVNFNKAEFLEDTIKSVISQNYANLEYIIIDGYSTDNSVEIIKKYENHLAYWVSEPDKGMTDALIKGFEKSTGEILAWLNSDDMYVENTFQIVSESYMKYRWDFFYGDMNFINKEGQFLKKVFSFDTNAKFYANGGSSMPQPSCFWTRKVYLTVGGLDPSFKLRMDADLFYRLFKMKNVKIFRINKVLSLFRIHDGQSHSWSTKEEYQKEIIVIKDRENFNFLLKLIVKFKVYKIFLFFKRFLN